MRCNLAELEVEAPAGFVPEETMTTLRVPAAQGLNDPRTTTPVRPNLVVHRRPLEGKSELALEVARTRKELSTSVPGISRVESADMTFADGVAGVVLAYSMAAPKGLEVCQLQALRLDGKMLTTLTISTERSHLDDARKAEYLRALASARVAPAGR
jgi:hypothetical protein